VFHMLNKQLKLNMLCPCGWQESLGIIISVCMGFLCVVNLIYFLMWCTERSINLIELCNSFSVANLIVGCVSLYSANVLSTFVCLWSSKVSDYLVIY
jgi:hypothetical protein